MNTIARDITGLRDSLETPEDLVIWLAGLGSRTAVARHADAGDLRNARDLRDAIRRLAAFATADPRPSVAPLVDLDAAAAIVNEVAAKRPADALDVRDGRLVLLSASAGSEAMNALADVALEAKALLTGPGAGQLRACLAPGCVRYFMKTHPRRKWCADLCGNRVRAARHYDRVRTSRTATGAPKP